MRQTQTYLSESHAPAIVAAYRAGYRSHGSLSDWDEALERFTRRHCAGSHSINALCSAEQAWCDGWDDAASGRARGHALRCPKGITGSANPDGHGKCEEF